MAQPYVGEIRMFAGNFAPAGWMFCDGSTVAIADYETLFNLIGTTYGGDGQNNFLLPDMRGRIPIHIGGTHTTMGEAAGVETVTLTVQQIPSHTHAFLASQDGGSQPGGAGYALASSNAVKVYASGTAAAAFDAQSITSAGGSQPHDNFQPYLCVNFIISLFGIYPSPT